MTDNILLPTDRPLPAPVAAIRAVDMAKASNSTLVMLNITEQMPSIRFERQGQNMPRVRFQCPDGLASHRWNRPHRTAVRGGGPETGRSGRSNISSSGPFAFSDISAGIGNESSENNKKEFD
jgi:hypothetical protein